MPSHPEDNATEDPSATINGSEWREWLGIGVNSFGGPAGQISVMHEAVVDRRRWLSERRFLHALNFVMVLPGPEAQQLATYSGWLVNGVRGAFVAGGLFVLPGFLVMLFVSAMYAVFGDVPIVAGLLRGLQAAVIAIVLQAVVRVGRRTLRAPLLVGLAAASFLALFAFHMPFPLVVLGAGVIGWAVGSVRPDLLADTQGEDDDSVEASRKYLLPEDEAVDPVRARAALRAALVCLVVWLLSIVSLRVVLGPDHVLSEIASLFGRAAIVTFGGAYAVLSYVSDEVITVYGWITPDDIAAGLGLAETTPGPLILVLQFIGFLAAYQDPGSLPPLMAGFVGACVAVWVTFLPCFMFIFAGAPYVERLRRSRPLHHALTSVGAAVVGVILNLALGFALTTLFATVEPHTWGPVTVPVPVLASVDWGATATAALAMVLVFVARFTTLRVLAVCALVGALGALIG